MAIRPILHIPTPCLREVAAPVVEINDEIKTLIKDMLDTMYDAPGVGLAAPQIGVMHRVIVMDPAGEEEEPAPLAMINPKITWLSEELRVHQEGCLSIPEQYAEVTRPAEVRVGWMDQDGNPQEKDFDGLWATCVQHEIDHLNGKLFIDYLGPMKRQMMTRRSQKMKRERARG